jgi:hypothetical protein
LRLKMLRTSNWLANQAEREDIMVRARRQF